MLARIRALVRRPPGSPRSPVVGPGGLEAFCENCQRELLIPAGRPLDAPDAVSGRPNAVPNACANCSAIGRLTVTGPGWKPS